VARFDTGAARASAALRVARSLLWTRAPMRRLAFVVVVLALSLVTSIASAQEGNSHQRWPNGADAPEPAAEYHWYGYQSFGADLAATLVVAGGVAAFQDDNAKYFIVAGASVYAFGSPLVHHANGHTGRAFLSFGLRTALPLGVGLLTMAAQTCGTSGGSSQCDGGDDIMPFVAGAATALAVVLFDDVVLGIERVERKPSWAPTVAPVAGGGLTLGLAGTF
jgi:hypothetical protein